MSSPTLLDRRGMLTGLAGLLMAPAIVRAETLMPVRSITPVADWIERQVALGIPIVGRHLCPERPLLLRTSLRDGDLVRNACIDFRACKIGPDNLAVRVITTYPPFCESRAYVHPENQDVWVTPPYPPYAVRLS